MPVEAPKYSKNVIPTWRARTWSRLTREGNDSSCHLKRILRAQSSSNGDRYLRAAELLREVLPFPQAEPCQTIPQHRLVSGDRNRCTVSSISERLKPIRWHRAAPRWPASGYSRGRIRYPTLAAVETRIHQGIRLRNAWYPISAIRSTPVGAYISVAYHLVPMQKPLTAFTPWSSSRNALPLPLPRSFSI